MPPESRLNRQRAADLHSYDQAMVSGTAPIYLFWLETGKHYVHTWYSSHIQQYGHCAEADVAERGRGLGRIGWRIEQTMHEPV